MRDERRVQNQRTRFLPHRRWGIPRWWGWVVLILLSNLFPFPEHTGGAMAQHPPPVREFTLGTSGQGRPIPVVQIGQGRRKLVVVGNTHGGPEANTYQLVQDLIAHFRTHPEEVPPDIRLYLIPTINPDGLALGSRFNGAGVDLNRNMNTNLDECPQNDWSRTVQGAYGVVSQTGGWYPDSQGESRLIRSFLLDASGAVFLHSNAGLVFPAYCDHPPSIQMAQVYAQAAGYAYQRFWGTYLITGSMSDWASSIGIAAITPELVTATSSEFEQNLEGLRAVMASPETLLPLPADHTIGGVVVPARIWRYWRTHGGERVFGLPLEPARPTAEGVSQTFTNVRLELRESQADTPFLVQPALLGVHILGDWSDWTEPARRAPELYGAFLTYWQHHGGASVFGMPVSEEAARVASDGQERATQYFERAAFAYYPEDDTVRLEPLGKQILMIEGIQASWLVPQIR